MYLHLVTTSVWTQTVDQTILICKYQASLREKSGLGARAEILKRALNWIYSVSHFFIQTPFASFWKFSEINETCHWSSFIKLLLWRRKDKLTDIKKTPVRKETVSQYYVRKVKRGWHHQLSGYHCEIQPYVIQNQNG